MAEISYVLSIMSRVSDEADVGLLGVLIVRPYDGKATAEVHDYHDELTGVLASSLAKRAPGYTSLCFPDPRKLPYTPSANTARWTQPGELPS